MYHASVDADFAVELGGEDEVLELPWSDPEGRCRYFDLRNHPEQLAQIEEARRWPALGEFLASLNAGKGRFETAKCDAWSSAEMNPEEEIFGASCKFGSYVDIIFRSGEAQLSFADHESMARQITKLLHRAPEMPSAAEFVIRRCSYHQGGDGGGQEGFYFTFYLFGYGDSEAEARERWTIALKLVENALRQLSAADFT
jgi:hypothetical protein